MNQLRTQQGFSLVEALVAIAVLLFAIVGPLTIVSRSLEGSLFAREQITASFLAQEGIELAHKIRNDAALTYLDAPASTAAWDWVGDSQWSACFSSDGCGLAFGTGNTLQVADCSTSGNCDLTVETSGVRSRYNHSSGAATPYNRVVRMTDNGSGEVLVTVTVSWETGIFTGNSSETTNAVYLYDVYQF